MKYFAYILIWGSIALFTGACQSVPGHLKDAEVILYRRKNPQTGKPTGISESFTLMKEAYLHARLSTDSLPRTKAYQLHFQWINPDGESFYTKEVIDTAGHTAPESAISLNPGTRTPGKYRLRVYYYRELLAEKSFELLSAWEPGKEISVQAPDFYISSYGGQPVKTRDSSFVLMKKTKLLMKFKTPVLDGKRQWIYHVDWKDETGRLISRKHFEGDSILSSSLPLSPILRSPGQYTMEIYLFDRLLATKNFRLLPPYDLSGVETGISFCPYYDKKNKRKTEFRNTYNIGQKTAVNACVRLTDKNHRIKTGEWLVELKWTDGTGKSFYTKKYNLKPKNHSAYLRSKISLSPEKRTPGEYSLQVLMFHETVASKAFRILPPVSLKGIRTKVSLYTKKTHTGQNTGKVFYTGKKRKVHARVEITGLKKTGKKTCDVLLEWVNPKSKTFFQKRMTLPINNDTLRLHSSIGISPRKRKTGKYKIRLYLFGRKAQEVAFTLKKE